MQSKKCFIKIVYTLFLGIYSIGALEIGIRVNPDFLFHKVISTETPDGSLKIAPGITLNADVNLFNFLSVGPQFNFYWISKNTTKTDYDAQIFDIGASLSAYYFPLSRLHLRGGLSGGGYTYVTKILNSETQKDDAANYYNFWYKAFAEAGFRVSPLVTLTGGVSFNSHIMESTILNLNPYTMLEVFRKK